LHSSPPVWLLPHIFIVLSPEHVASKSPVGFLFNQETYGKKLPGSMPNSIFMSSKSLEEFYVHISRVNHEDLFDLDFIVHLKIFRINIRDI